MDTDTEGEYVAALTERDREIYRRGYNIGLLARSRIDFGSEDIPTGDPRTQRGDNADGACNCGTTANPIGHPESCPSTHGD